jgi:uncharacterized membrane protein YphA (DoxX/SURF4 family)
VGFAKADKMTWIGRVISVLMTLVFIMSAVMKLKGGAEVTEGLGKMGFTESILLPLALIELTCAVLYLIPQTAVLGAVLLAGYMGGTIVTHWRVGDLFYQQVIMGLLIWLGIWLREPRLRAILPFRKV